MSTDKMSQLKDELENERAIVSRIWVQLGSPTYAQLNGRSIYDLIDEMKGELAAERARLDHVFNNEWPFRDRDEIDNDMKEDAK